MASSAALPGRPRVTLRQRLSLWDRSITAYGFIAPFFLLFIAFGLYPLLDTAWVALHRESLTASGSSWVGFDNFTWLFGNEYFRKSLLNTVTIGILSTVPQLLIALGLAHLLNMKMRGRTFFRVIMLMPYATSVAAAALVFAQIFGTDSGLLNWLLGTVGISPVAWEPGHWTSQIAVSTIVIWRWTGYNALIYLAAMQAVPGDLYEAAAIDGASKWQQFRNVTLPSLKPTILFTVVVSSIGATQLFGEPLLFSAGAGNANPLGGSSHQYQTMGLLMYQQAFTDGSLGRAAATAWTMFVIIILVTVLNTLLVSGRIRIPGLRRKGARA